MFLFRHSAKSQILTVIKFIHCQLVLNNKYVFPLLFSPLSFSDLTMNAVHQFHIVFHLSPIILSALCFLSLSVLLLSLVLLTALQRALHHSHLSAFALVWSPSHSEGLHSLIAAWQKPPFEELHSTFYSFYIRLCVCVCVCVLLCVCVQALWVCVLTNSVNCSVSQFVRWLSLWLLAELCLDDSVGHPQHRNSFSASLGLDHFQHGQFWKYNF